MEPLPTYEEAAARMQKILLSLWMAFAGALGVYLLLVFMLQQSPPPTESAGLSLLRLILIGMSVLSVGMALVLERFQLDPERLKIQIPPAGQPLAPWLCSRYQTTFIFTAALIEAVAIYGLLLFFLGDTQAHFLAFIGAAGALHGLVLFPRVARYPALVRELGPELEMFQQG